MANITLYSLLFIGIPLLIITTIFRGRIGRLLAFIIFGMLICIFCGELNTLICNTFNENYNEYSSSIAPIFEEILKAFPVLIYAFVGKPTKEDLLTCALLVGVGFSLEENSIVIANNINNMTVYLAVVRTFGAGLMHIITTTLVGLGLIFVRTKRKLFFTGTIGLLSVAIIYHSIYNSLVLSNYEILGLLLPILTSIPLAIYHIKKFRKNKKLNEE